MLWKGKPPFTSALWHQQIASTSQILLMLLAVGDRSWEMSRFIQGNDSSVGSDTLVQRWCVCFPNRCVTKRVLVKCSLFSCQCDAPVLCRDLGVTTQHRVTWWGYDIQKEIAEFHAVCLRWCIVYTDLSSVSSSVPSLLHSILGRYWICITVLKIIYGHVLIVFLYAIRKWQ